MPRTTRSEMRPAWRTRNKHSAGYFSWIDRNVVGMSEHAAGVVRGVRVYCIGAGGDAGDGPGERVHSRAQGAWVDQTARPCGAELLIELYAADRTVDVRGDRL